MTDPNRLNFAQFARLVGVDPSRISQAVKEGKLTVLTDDQGVRYLDGVTAQREWRENTDPAKAIGPRVRDSRRKEALLAETLPTDPQDEASSDAFKIPSLTESRARLEHFKALTAKAAYEEKIGTLVSAEAVKREAFEAARALREAILSVPDRLAAELAAETDPNRIHSRITAELVVALEAVAAREPEASHDAPDDDSGDGEGLGDEV